MTTQRNHNTSLSAPHTPGPWEHYATQTVRADNGKLIADVYDGDETAEGQANAHLIAAAPELLAALKDVREAYQKMFSVMPVAWQTYDDIINAAIAKAEGKIP